MTLADVGLGQELSGEACLAQICKWVKAEQMCVARRTVAGGQVSDSGPENPTGLWELVVKLRDWKAIAERENSSWIVRPESGLAASLPSERACINSMNNDVQMSKLLHDRNTE